MVEGFFQYAIPKFQIVLGCIEFVVENPGLSAINASDIVAEVQAALHQVSLEGSKHSRGSFGSVAHTLVDL